MLNKNAIPQKAGIPKIGATRVQVPAFAGMTLHINTCKLLNLDV